MTEQRQGDDTESGRPRHPERPCLNCGDPTYGEFCPTCGQHKVDVQVSVRTMVRDLLEIETQTDTIPLFACGRAPAIAGFGPASFGAIGEPVICGGVPVNTGDLIFGDDDGLTVVPWAKVEGVLDLAMRNIAFDDKERAWIESGRTVFDLLTMLSGNDGTQYKERKFRWAAQPSIDPLLD